MRHRIVAAAAIVLSLLAVLSCGRTKSAPPGGAAVRLATTSSVKDSGLLAPLLRAFEARTGYHVEVISVGSGKALEMLHGGTADVAITHAPPEEQAALASGAIARRTPFMHNEFAIVGPKDLQGEIAGAGDVGDVMRKIAGSGKTFVSRGDGSGTHLREQSLWRLAGIGADSSFVLVAKAGMGATLERASAEKAFTLTDRSTYLARRKTLDLAILFQGDPALRNDYSLLEPVSQGANREGAHALERFLRSPEGRSLIGGFGVAEVGEPLFTPEP